MQKLSVKGMMQVRGGVPSWVRCQFLVESSGWVKPLKAKHFCISDIGNFATNFAY